MQTIRIQTAQNVFIEYHPASIGERILATLIDGIIAWSYVIAAFSLLNKFATTEPNWWVFMLILLPFFFYDLLSEIFLDGQTIGKKALNIKVVKLDGTQPTLASYLLRWLLRPVDLFFFGAVAMITIAGSSKGQRLGDMAAGTSVILTRRRTHFRDAVLPEAPEDYTPLYPEAANLSDRDVAIIREALQAYHKGNQQDSWLLNSLAGKVQSLLNIHTQQSYLNFLETVLKDHAHLSK